MSGDRLCHTCGFIVYDYVAAHCTRPHCAAKADIERNNKRGQGTRPPVANEPKPTYYDDGGGA